VPTIEEYEQILHISLNGGVPYRHLEQHTSILTLSPITKISQDELSDRLTAIRGIEGLSQRFLEAYLLQLSIKGDWETFMDVLALTLYGVMVFPNVVHYVDYIAVDIFVVVKTRFENPVTAILADTLLALDLCHERNMRKLTCCVPSLYIWMMARIGDNVIGINCPIKLVTRRKRETKSGKKWGQYFAGQNQTKILWQPFWQQRTSLIYSCANFPNVLLIGTKGCINYNPILAQRQFGYPIRGAPTPTALIALVCYYKDGFVTETLRQIRSVWKDTFRAKRDMRP